MIRTTKFICAAVLLVLSTQSHAGNRDEGDSLFPKKTDSTIVEQAVIGLGEYILFNALHVKEHGLTPLKDQLEHRDQKNIAAMTERLNDPDLLPEDRIALKTEIMKTEDNLIKRRVKVLMNLEAAEKRSRFIQKAFYAGQALIVVDLFGRVYVWQKLDRDPSISPVATFVLKPILGGK